MNIKKIFYTTREVPLMVARDAMPLLWNEYKIQIAKTLVKRAIIECL